MTNKFGRMALLAAACAVVWSAPAAERTIKDGVSDWTLADSYVDNLVPVAGDVVKIPAGATVSLAAPSASLELANSLSRIVPGEGSVLTVSVASGEASLDVPVTDRGSAYGGNGFGTLVKTGSGLLNLSNVTGVKESSTVYSYWTGLDIQDGSVRFPQDQSKIHFAVGDVTVAAGAKLHLLTIADSSESIADYGMSYLNSLSGKGEVTSVAPDAAPRFLRLSCNSDFSGKMSGNIVVSLNQPNTRLNLTAADSTFLGHDDAIRLDAEGTRLGLRSLMCDAEHAVDGTPETPSSMGLNWSVRGFAGNVGFVYLGDGDETTYMGVNALLSPFVVDAGEQGGVTFGNGREWVGYYGSATQTSYMQHLVLDGDNVKPVVFCPYLRTWTDNMAPEAARTNCTWYITKRGTGTWRFDYNSRQDWRGGLCVEDGTLQFPMLGEAGVNGPLGKATMCQKPYCGPWDPANNVPYAIAFGGTPALPRFEYVGSNIVMVTTRPIGLKTQGAIVNSGVRPYGTPRFYMKGVLSAGGDGEKTLVLDGTNEVMDTICDISDGSLGGTVGVTKRGTGNWVLGGPLNFTGRLAVENGTLYLNDNRRYRWFKFTTGLTRYADEACAGDRSNNDSTQFAEFALYDKDGNRVNIGMAGEVFGDENANEDPVGIMRDYTALAPGRAAVGRMAYKYDKSKLTFDQGDEPFEAITAANADSLVVPFDDVPATSESKTYHVQNGTKILETNPQCYLSLYMHVANTVKEVSSYDFAYFVNNQAPNPYSWTFEGSVDGLHWVKLHTKTKYALPASADLDTLKNYWSCPNASGQPVAFASGQIRRGWAVQNAPTGAPTSDLSATPVFVAAHARLVAEGEFTLGSLDVDCQNGIGSIEGFAFAKSGTLNLVGLSSVTEKTVEVGFDHIDQEGQNRIASWVLKSDGKELANRSMSIRDGKLVIRNSSALIIRIH